MGKEGGGFGFWDGVQAGLDVLGMIPAVGIIADAANVVVSVARGNFGDAALSALAMVPFVGMAAGGLKLGKAGLKIAKALQKVEKIVDAADAVLDPIGTIGGKVFSAVGESLAKNIPKLSDEIMDFGKGIFKKPSSPSTKRNSSNNSSSSKDKNSTTAESKNSKIQEKCGDPIDIVTGSFVLEQTDFVINDINEQFILKRTYESIHKNENYLLGSKWILNIDTKIVVEENKVTILMPEIYLEVFHKIENVWVNERGGNENYQLIQKNEQYILKDVRKNESYVYNEKGQIISIIDKNDNTIEFLYINHSLDKIQFSSKQFLKFIYKNNKVSKIVDILGRTVEYSYDGNLLEKVTYPNNGTTQYTYNKEGYITSITDQNGHTYVQNTYDTQGRVIGQQLVNGQEYTIEYNDADRINTSITTSNHSKKEYHYNLKNLVMKIVYKDESYENLFCEESSYEEMELDIKHHHQERHILRCQTAIEVGIKNMHNLNMKANRLI